MLAAEVGAAAYEAGMCSLPGSSPDVARSATRSAAGSAGSGAGTASPATGVTAIEVVTADGERRHVDADSEPELFWALRGGGGGFAIVAAIEARLVPTTRSTAAP